MKSISTTSCHCAYAALRMMIVCLGLLPYWLPIIGVPICVARAQESSEELAAVRAEAESLKKAHYAIGERVMTDFPNDFQALRLMGYIHSSHGNQVEMVACWEQCRDLEPGRADILDQLARHALKSENYKGAIDYWKQAIALNPKLKDAYRHVGEALLSLGRTDDARRALQHQLKMSPTSAETHYLLGEAWFQLQEFAKAKQSYETTIRLQRNHTHAYYGLIKTCARLGQSDMVAKYSQSFQQLEAAAIKADQVVRAEFDDLQQMRSNLANTYVEAGRLYLTSDPNLAERMWQQAALADPRNTACRNELAKLYVKQRNAADALSQYVELAKLEPQNPSYLRQMGFLHGRLGDLGQAEAAFKKMVDVAPQQAEPYRNLAKFYLTANRQNRLAEELAAKSLSLDPAAEGYFLWGWALAKNGKISDGLAAIKKAVDMKPDDPTYRRLLNSIEQSRQAK